MNDILKIDLDLNIMRITKNFLKERLIFLDKINILNFDKIKKVELIKKNRYSARIYLKKSLKFDKDIIIIQSILGDDYKRTAVNFRDLNLNIKSFNRLFDVKRNVNGEYIKAKYYDITKFILEKNETQRND